MTQTLLAEAVEVGAKTTTTLNGSQTKEVVAVEIRDLTTATNREIETRATSLIIKEGEAETEVATKISVAGEEATMDMRTKDIATRAMMAKATITVAAEAEEVEEAKEAMDKATTIKEETVGVSKEAATRDEQIIVVSFKVF